MATKSDIIKWAPRLPADLLKNCKVLPDRIALIEKMQKGGIVAEVGTQYGRFAKRILEICEPTRIELIDIDFSLFDKSQFDSEQLSRKIGVNVGDSSTVLLQFPVQHFDWIYIDGNHSYEGVVKDINSAKTRVKEGGLLIFNDYTHWSIPEMHEYGIPVALNEFCKNEGWEFVYLALHGGGFHDVAVRKPR